MFQWLYDVLWRFVPVLIRHRLRKRAEKSPAYRENWGERFGKPHPHPISGAIWIHAVSVGETPVSYTHLTLPTILRV